MSCSRLTLSKLLMIPLLSVTLSGCSTTETINDFLSSTSPGDWYSRDGLPKAEHKMDVFLASNMENLKDDLAKGRGEYLEAASELLAVAPERRPEFSLLAQERYELLAAQDRSGLGASLLELSRPLQTR